MARGRQQKWICLDCGAAFAVQGIAPKMCCACGSARLGRAPSLELAENFAEKRVELERICHELNGAYGRYASLKTRYDEPTGSSRSGVGISRQKSINNWPRSSSERGR